MANTFINLHYHIIFGTKHREPFIKADFEERLWGYLGGIAKQNQSTPVAIGGVEDHVHLLLGLTANASVSTILQRIKGGSSVWAKDHLPGCTGFGWQDGYAAFSVSRSMVSGVEKYIREQREHRRVKSFQEEYREFLDRHGIAYEEKYLWD
jgi:putative transposase